METPLQCSQDSWIRHAWIFGTKAPTFCDPGPPIISSPSCPSQEQTPRRFSSDEILHIHIEGSGNIEVLGSSQPPSNTSVHSHTPSTPTVLAGPKVLTAHLDGTRSAAPFKDGIKKITRARLLYHLLAKQKDFRIPIENRKDAKLHPEDPKDLRLIAGIFGERKTYILSVQDLLCHDCVHRQEHKFKHVLRTKDALRKIRAHLRSAYTDKESTLLALTTYLQGAKLTKCTHNCPSLQLLGATGLPACKRMTRIRLIGNFHNFHEVVSATSNLLAVFRNIQRIQIILHHPKHGKLGNDEAYKLSKIFGRLERELPVGEGLRITGLNKHPILEKYWKKLRREWYELKRGEKSWRGYQWENDYDDLPAIMRR